MHLLRRACEWTEAGHAVVVARVVATHGHAPRPAGSMMLVRDDGMIEGSVSGGCVETDVIRAAQEILAGGPAVLLTYGGSDAGEWQPVLACGSRLEIFAEKLAPGNGLSPEKVRKVLAAVAERHTPVLATRPDADTVTVLAETPKDALPVPVYTPDAGCDMMHDEHGVAWFIQPVRPPLRLIMIGAVHITRVLAAIAQAAEFEVVIIDPRTALMEAQAFPGAILRDDWPDEALEQLHIDDRTAIVALTHDSKLDDPALETAVRSQAFYIGALGSRRTHQARLERLLAAGCTKDEVRKIRGPVGLPLGAVGAAEIAVSILAEIIAVWRQAPLSERPDWWSAAGQSPGAACGTW